jgi:TPR repeat protein
MGAAVFPQAKTTEEMAPLLASAPIPSAAALAPAKLPPASVEAEALVERGSVLFGDGDLSSARELYEHAAAAGHAQAAMYLALTYDTSFLRQARFAKSVRGDPERAAYWHRRARDLGADESEVQLAIRSK